MAKTTGVYFSDLDLAKVEKIKEFLKETAPLHPSNFNRIISFCIASTYQGVLTARETMKAVESVFQQELNFEHTAFDMQKSQVLQPENSISINSATCGLAYVKKIGNGSVNATCNKPKGHRSMCGDRV
jgi:hypothetical protein